MGPEGPNQWTSVLVYLLPYMEAQTVFDRLTQTLNIGVDAQDDNYWKDQNAWVAGQTTIGGLLCPSLPNTPPDCETFDHTWGEFIGNVYWLHARGWTPDEGLGLTHYQAVAGIYGIVGKQRTINRISNDKYLIGVYTTRSKISATRIADGMSKMLSFGKAPGSIGQGIQDETATCNGQYVKAFAWIGTATLPTTFGLDVSRQNGSPNAGARYQTHWAYFGSLHLGDIVPFVYADGSVHGIHKRIDQTVYRGLSTIGGGEIVNGDEL